jgi:hypothetical protein
VEWRLLAFHDLTFLVGRRCAASGGCSNTNG